MEKIKIISLLEWQVILQTMNFYKREEGFVDYDETGKLKFYDNDPCINGVHACPVTRTDVLKNISDYK